MAWFNFHVAHFVHRVAPEELLTYRVVRLKGFRRHLAEKIVDRVYVCSGHRKTTMEECVPAILLVDY